MTTKTNKKAILSAVALGATLAMAPAWARQPQPPQQQEQTSTGEAGTKQAAEQHAGVGRFVGRDTVMVAHVDLSKIDAQSAGQWLRDVAMAVRTDPNRDEKLIRDVDGRAKLAQQWVTDIKQAGARELFCVMNLQKEGPPATATIVPLKEGANAAKLKELLLPKADSSPPDLPVDLTAATIAGSLVVAPKGMVQLFQESRPDVPSGLGAAMMAAEASAARVAFLPNDQLRATFKQFAGMMPQNAKDEARSGDLKDLPESVEWAVLSVSAPPEVAVKLTIDAKDPQGAQDISKQIQQVFADVKRNKTVQGEVSALDRTLEMLKPEVKGDRVTVSLDSQQVNTLVKDALPNATRQNSEPVPAAARERTGDQQTEQQQQPRPNTDAAPRP